MGTLKPGATYVYERAEGIIYARESGADPSTRQVVGYEDSKAYDPVSGHKIDTVFGMDLRRVAELVAILQAAETNPTLQDALERAIIIYKLTKTNE
jgi:hypothetical protein